MKEITTKPIRINTAEITIEGDSDLILNQMNAVNRQALIDQRKDRSKNR